MIRIFLVTLILSGCGVVTSEDWVKAEEACESHDGVEKVYVRTTQVKCNNGYTIIIK